MLLPQLRYCTKPFAAGPQIVRARLLRLLLECVKNVNRISSRRQVEDPEGPTDLDPDLSNAGSNRLHGFPIVWFKSLLDAPKLEAHQPSHESGKRSDVTPLAAEPDEGFVRHWSRQQYTSFCMTRPDPRRRTFGQTRRSRHPHLRPAGQPTNLARPGIEGGYTTYTLDDLYAFLSTFELARDPGEEWAYSNVGMGLLARLLARRAELPYDTLLRTRVLRPLGASVTV
jgi:hypothetical protein